MNDFENLVAELADDVAAVRPAPHPYLLSLGLIAAAGIYLMLALAVSGVRHDWVRAASQPWFVAEIMALSMIIVAASLSSALLSFPDLHQKRRLAFAPLWAFGLFLAVMLFAWQADNPPAALPEHNIECISCIVLLALLPTGWTLFAVRKLASTHHDWAGSIAILYAFGVGALWLRLQESNDSIVHVVAWHYLPMLAAGVIGLWIGKWLLKW